MADYRRNLLFGAALNGLHSELDSLAVGGVPDAQALIDRRDGSNNLQGHYQSVVPLALWFCRRYSQHLPALRAATDVRRDMTSGSTESRDRGLWVPIQQDLIAFLNRDGHDVLSEELGSSAPQDAAAIANTYLSVRFGGAQTRGGAGDTVFKRAAKLIAHVSIG